MEYEVTWGDGPLGLTLRPDLGEDMPPVVGRITRQDSAAAMARVAVGHMLVSINGMDTARQGYDHVVTTLQTIPRPATLRFRVPRAFTPSPGGSYREPRSSSRRIRGSTGSTSTVGSERRSKREQYTVVWTEGPLGMILRPDDDDCHVPCIRKITGKGAGTGMERATVGDILVAVNGQETKALGFRSTISLLKTIRKPAVLKFKCMGRRISRKLSSQELPGGSRSVSGVPVNEVGAYDIVWREGDLGLKLKPGHRDVPVLSKLTGKGTASGLQNANVGDELVSVNGTLVEGEAYQDTLRMLKHSPKPAVLRFRPGKDRRESMMSVRSNPSTMREVTKVSSRHHVPIYEDSALPSQRRSRSRSPASRARPAAASGAAGASRSTAERPKRKKRIPLDVARELVAASQGSDLNHAIFAGIPITAIEEGSKEAHLLRIQAKLCITNQAGSKGVREAKDKREQAKAKEALSRAEQEAKVLQEALQKVKDQAKKYEEVLEAQSRERVLGMAVRHKPKEVVNRQNNVIHELEGVISGFKRDSYHDVDIVPPVLDEQEQHVQQIMDDLQNVMSIPVVVPTAKYCAECGATEAESKLDMDDDGEYYCKDCWDKFLELPGAAAAAAAAPVSTIQEGEEPPVSAPAPVDAEEPTPAPIEVEEPTPATPPAEDEDAKEPEPPAVAPVESAQEEEVVSPAASTDSLTRSMNRLSAEDREAEEKQARKEAERKLLEIKELRRSGSMMPMERQTSKKVVDRSRRERRGLEELAQALLEEEERARAEGNLGLAKKLSAQRARTMAEASGESRHAGIGGTPYASMGNLLASHDTEFQNGHSASPPPNMGKSASAVESEVAVPPPLLNRSVSADSSLPPPIPTPVAAETPGSPTTTADATASSSGGNDYADVNSDEEAEDQVNMSDSEDDVLREMEEKNFALARQLDEAHSVIERARMSISMSGDDEDDDDDDASGLSEEQISLFKKLTSQADERASMVDRLHPQDDSDSDSDSEAEDEEDEGVWI